MWRLQTRLDAEVFVEHSASSHFGAYWSFWHMDVKPLCSQFFENMHHNKNRKQANRLRVAISDVFHNALAEGRLPNTLLDPMCMYVTAALQKCTQESMTLAERITYGSAHKAASAYAIKLLEQQKKACILP